MHDLETRFIVAFYGLLSVVVLAGMAAVLIATGLGALGLIVIPLLISAVVVAGIFLPTNG